MSAGSPAQAGPVTTFRPGASTADAAVPARRLTLTAAEWAVLVDGRLTGLPPAFPLAGDAVGERDDAVTSLLRRGVMVPAAGAEEAAPVPAVAGTLGVLRRPLVNLLLDVTGRAGARHGWFAVGSGFVAGVLTLPGGGMELSLAPDVRLAAVVARAAPDAVAVTGPGSAEATTVALPGGRLPLGLLDGGASPTDGAGPDELDLAEQLLRRTGGSLACLVLGRAGEDLGVGQVSWLATDVGWVGLRPVMDGSPRRLVDVLPVQAADLGAWAAPAVAALLESSDELA